MPRRSATRLGGRRSAWGMGVVFGLLVTGCDGLLKNDELPPDVTDPTVIQTPAGALAAYHGAVAQFQLAFGAYQGTGHTDASFVTVSGLLSDELQNAIAGAGGYVIPKPEDQRSLPETEADIGVYAYTFGDLQRTRAQAGQAIRLLTRYVPEQPALAGRLYGLAGYAEVFLAELFCTGIPLSTLNDDGTYSVRPGSSTEEVLAHAAALFDSALALSADSVQFLNLARVGKARALLGLGQYAAAAAAVSAVPDNYAYRALYAVTTAEGNAPNFSWFTGWDMSIPDREGGNGLDYRSSGDPRSKATQMTNGAVGPFWYPAKYTTNGASPIVVASGIEARLIEAEAALQAGDVATWLAKLNELRTDGTYSTTTASPPDTLWHAGTGGVTGLKPLGDPGASLSGAAADSVRVGLLFRERGFWLFLTGHRQGDLRRLIREYGRQQDAVYPTGAYLGSGIYGADVTAPVPATERTLNPLFTGCASRGA